MKKVLLSISLGLLATTLLFTVGCKKDDTTAPVISLNGSASVEVSLNTSSWADPGATATDDQDGTVTVTSDYSTTNPDLNMADTYTITYTAEDAAGNRGTAVRTVRVKNDAENFAGTYTVHDTCPGVVFNYSQIISVDLTLNNRLHFNKFADYANNTGIYATKLANGTLEIPSQTATGIGSGSGSCSIADHRFNSNSYTAATNGFILVYTDEVTSPAQCAGSTTCTATFTK